MKRSEIYLRAAKMVDARNDFSCNAVARADDYGSGVRGNYRELMLSDVDGFSGENVNYIWGVPGKEGQFLRVMLLCLAAAIAESEGE